MQLPDVPAGDHRQRCLGKTTKEIDMSSKVSSGRNHTHSESKHSGQQAPGSTPPGARKAGSSPGASQQPAGASQQRDAASGNKQSASKTGKS
jgi:hypothetical protein